MKHYKITLSSDDVPTQWYNINADLPVELPMPINSEGKDQIASLQKAFTKAGLERITGINQKQLWHYASGTRNPRPEQSIKIESALHRLGEELIAINL